MQKELPKGAVIGGIVAAVVVFGGIVFAILSAGSGMSKEEVDRADAQAKAGNARMSQYVPAGIPGAPGAPGAGGAPGAPGGAEAAARAAYPGGKKAGGQ